jgi:hypothetical protein
MSTRVLVELSGRSILPLKNFGDSSKLVEGTCDFTRFCSRKGLVLLNVIRQLLWYLALLPLRVASIPVPSSKRRISIGIGNALTSLI